MLGFAPLAAAPLGALGAGGVSYDAAFGDALAITDGIVARQVFVTAVDEASSGAISVAVTASTFNAAVSFAADAETTSSAAVVFVPSISEAATGADAAVALVGFSTAVTESVLTTDSALVEASEFNATATDAADAVDSVSTAAVMAVSVSDSAEIDDADSASYLWNLINNAQSTSWTVVKTQN